MSDLSVFNFNSHDVRVSVVDDVLWFNANDVAASLGYANPRDALRKHVNKEDRAVNAINESGMYSLVLRSRKPQARAFKRWVTNDVLPAIRKNGSYYAGDPNGGEYLTENQRAYIYAAVIDVCKSQGVSHKVLWTRLNEHMGVHSYKNILRVDYAKACNFLGVPVRKGVMVKRLDGVQKRHIAQVVRDRSKRYKLPETRVLGSLCTHCGVPDEHSLKSEDYEKMCGFLNVAPLNDGGHNGARVFDDGVMIPARLFTPRRMIAEYDCEGVFLGFVPMSPGERVLDIDHLPAVIAEDATLSGDLLVDIMASASKALAGRASDNVQQRLLGGS